MVLESLKAHLVHELQELYSAETQEINELPQQPRAVQSEDLRDAIEVHLEETNLQRIRLDEILGGLSADPTGHHCETMRGLIDEALEVIRGESQPALKDAAVIAALKRVEHFEIAAYGNAMGLTAFVAVNEVHRMLRVSLEEETAADKKLKLIALLSVNPAAAGEAAHCSRAARPEVRGLLNENPG